MDFQALFDCIRKSPETVAWGVTAVLVIGLAAGYFVPRYRRRRGSANCVEIYVGNLSYDMSEAQLRREFEKHGGVKSARIITNRFNQKSKGFGFVEMPVRAEAEAAIKALHDREIMGRRLRVNEAKNKLRD